MSNSWKGYSPRSRPISPPAFRNEYVGEGRGPQVEDNLGLLTDRDREVLQLIARKHTMEKLDLHNTAEIVRFAVRRKIVD